MNVQPFENSLRLSHIDEEKYINDEAKYISKCKSHIKKKADEIKGRTNQENNSSSFVPNKTITHHATMRADAILKWLFSQGERLTKQEA